MAVLPSSLGDLQGIHLSSIHSLLKFVLFVPVIFLVTYILFNEVVRLRARIPKLPGPRGYPLLGSLPSLRGTATSDEYRIWAERYGDVFQVQLGNVPAVIVNSAAAARALFITQREATNSRPVFYVLHKKVQQGASVMSIGTSPWDESCKRRRKVAATALNKTSTESYLPVSPHLAEYCSTVVPSNFQETDPRPRVASFHPRHASHLQRGQGLGRHSRSYSQVRFESESDTCLRNPVSQNS